MRDTLYHFWVKENHHELILSAAERTNYWQGQSSYVMPTTWSDRLAYWCTGRAFRIPSHPRAMPLDFVHDGNKNSMKCGEPDAVALWQLWQHKWWASSHRAIFHALLAWKTWDIGPVAGMPSVAWMADCPQLSGTQWMTHAVSPIPGGFYAGRVGTSIVIFHPSVLGPVLRISADGDYESALGVTLDHSDGQWAMRGAVVPLGYQNGDEIEPITYPGGWWPLR